MTDAAFSSFLVRSLATLEAQHPVGFARMLECLGERRVWLEVDSESVVLESDGRALARRARPGNWNAHARADQTTLVAILQGELALEEAVLEDRILLRGRLEDLAAFFAALQAYFNVAVRCPAFAPLLSDYLQVLAAPAQRRSGAAQGAQQ